MTDYSFLRSLEKEGLSPKKKKSNVVMDLAGILQFCWECNGCLQTIGHCN
jgi:hypothetical protein